MMQSLYRLGHDHDLDCSPPRHPGEPAVFVLGQSCDHGLRAALCHSGSGRVSRPAVGGIRRRWRSHHADGRACHLRKIRLGRKGRRHKEQCGGQIKWEQMVFLGFPEFGCELQPIDFAGVARAAAFRPSSSTTPRNAARHCAGAGYIGAGPHPAVVDPNEPPLPPKVRWREQKSFPTVFFAARHTRGKSLSRWRPTPSVRLFKEPQRCRMQQSTVFRRALPPSRPMLRRRMGRLHGIRPRLCWLRSMPVARPG